MFGTKKKGKFNNHIDSLVGIKTEVNGDINFTGGLHIDGRVNGNVIAVGDEHCTVVLSEKGCVEGKIQVANVIVDGTVKGPIHASEYLELQQDAKIFGDVYYGSMEMHLGASVEGKMIHQDKNKTEKMVTLIPAAPE